MKQFNFALDKSTIGSWVNASGQELMEKMILAAQTIDMVTVKPNIKYKEELKYLDTDLLLQAGGCNFTTSGTTSLTKKDIQVFPYKVNESLCPEDLNDTALALSMSAGFNESLPFEAQYLELKSKKLAALLENKIWVNASGSSEFLGWLNAFKADSAVVDAGVNFAATGITDSVLIGMYETMIDAIPAEIVGQTDLVLFLGQDAFRKLNRAFKNTNNIQLQKFDFNGVSMYDFPGYEHLKIRPVNGLNASNNTTKKAVITLASNLVFATDLQSEIQAPKIWWSQDDQNVKFAMTFKAGVNYFFSEYVVVSNKL